MRRVNLFHSVVAASAVVVLAAGCGAGEGSSAAEFAGRAGQGVHLDYDPLATPADAVAQGELIVRGTLVDVTDGVTFRGAPAEGADRSARTFATLVIEVDSVVKGGAAKGDRVYVLTYKSTAVSSRELADLNRRPKLVAVLDDITDWTPSAGTEVVRPSAMPAGATLYMAFPDGLWLQGSADREMHGITSEPDQLAPAWGRVRTVDQYAVAVEKAAKPG